MLLRYCIIHMCLDIEHQAKVILLQAIEASSEDGYDIVTDFRAGNELRVVQSLASASSSPYCRDLIGSYQNEMPVWVFVEVISLGVFIAFFQYAAKRLQKHDLIDEGYSLRTIQQLRNAAAHNNCIINDLAPNTAQHKPNHAILRAFHPMGISNATHAKKMSSERIRQIVTLLYTYRKLIPEQCMRKYRVIELHKAIDRMHKHIDFYQNCDNKRTSFEFLKIVVDNWFPVA